MFTLTPAAAEQIKAAAVQGDATGMPLRVAARRAVDGSIEYGMGFDEPADGEHPVLESDGVAVLIAPPSRELLEGATLDFVELETGELSFIFIPPAAAGCGSGRCGSGGCGGAASTEQ